MSEEKRTRKKFWMLYVEGEGVPHHQHWTACEAHAEAERLARETEKDVFLLEATHFARTAPPTPPICWQATT